MAAFMLCPHTVEREYLGLPLLACKHAKLLQSSLTLRDPRDCSLPGSSVHGILQARILEGVALPSSRRSSWPRDGTCHSCIAGRFFTTEPPQKPLPLLRTLISLWGPYSLSTFMASSKPNYLPKAASPNTIPLRVRVSAYDTSIQPMTETTTTGFFFFSICININIFCHCLK